MNSFVLHGKHVTDSGLYPWALGSISRALFFRAQTNECRGERGVACITAYYSLFHLSLFLLFGCPRHLSAAQRQKIHEEMKDGLEDPNPAISHAALLAFLRTCSAEGLPPLVIEKVFLAQGLRVFMNYGPRVQFTPDAISVNTCQKSPSDLDDLVDALPAVFEAAVVWACANGEDDGVWIATALSQADVFFGSSGNLYQGWCSDKVGAEAEAARRSLETIANARVFPKPA